MYGPHVNALNVYVKAGSNVGAPVWTRNGTQGDKWIQGSVTLNSHVFFNVSLTYDIAASLLQLGYGRTRT